MRYLLIALALSTVLLSERAYAIRPDAAPMWDPPCLTMRAAHDANYFRIIQNMGAGEGRSLSSTIPVSMTVTRAMTTTTTTLDRSLYTITPDDLDARFDSAEPFTIYTCAPGFNPHQYIPLVVR